MQQHISKAHKTLLGTGLAMSLLFFSHLWCPGCTSFLASRVSDRTRRLMAVNRTSIEVAYSGRTRAWILALHSMLFSSCLLEEPLQPWHFSERLGLIGVVLLALSLQSKCGSLRPFSRSCPETSLVRGASGNQTRGREEERKRGRLWLKPRVKQREGEREAQQLCGRCGAALGQMIHLSIKCAISSGL